MRTLWEKLKSFRSDRGDMRSANGEIASDGLKGNRTQAKNEEDMAPEEIAKKTWRQMKERFGFNGMNVKKYGLNEKWKISLKFTH